MGAGALDREALRGGALEALPGPVLAAAPRPCAGRPRSPRTSKRSARGCPSTTSVWSTVRVIRTRRAPIAGRVRGSPADYEEEAEREGEERDRAEHGGGEEQREPEATRSRAPASSRRDFLQRVLDDPAQGLPAGDAAHGLDPVGEDGPRPAPARRRARRNPRPSQRRVGAGGGEQHPGRRAGSRPPHSAGGGGSPRAARRCTRAAAGAPSHRGHRGDPPRKASARSATRPAAPGRRRVQQVGLRPRRKG